MSTNLVGVVSEAKPPTPTPPSALSPADEVIISRHFAERDEVELRLLGNIPEFPDTEVQRLVDGSINSPETLEWLQARRPDIVMLYGSSIIKPPLLNVYGDRMINLHLGLSPYYRGSGTNFWPLVYGEPECVGATIHLAVQSVDAGAILAQVRPNAEVGDRAHELGTKTIIAALDLLPDVLSQYVGGQVHPQGQDLSLGRTFRNKDFNAQAVQTMWDRFSSGMMAGYLAAAEERRGTYPIVGNAMALA